MNEDRIFGSILLGVILVFSIVHVATSPTPLFGRWVLTIPFAGWALLMVLFGRDRHDD